MALGGRLHVGWAHQMRHREGPALDRGQLRWYQDETLTYRFTAGYVIPSILKSLARVTVEGLENIPSTERVVLAANHRDNLDAYLLSHLVPRMVHTAARRRLRPRGSSAPCGGGWVLFRLTPGGCGTP